ncbi:enoyl-CoA hydratase/isomerase family protein [Natrinema sp. 1APR25-10V2]|uniref:enoyl-CoA hydratase/isomerase family protein n=1 Tax=Natrinema sp. 1APR25-10V2 TaxID=2951081 RepID=UPI0028758B30|nr:enoyl-CoA hydratase/isomerase family protein [Natrinema sp. 1APR25-10V2]MDS0478659.1 enoyl-CoA hydratase/isomerase family protein [Natrinema sp. 1APR25-10V2]
MREIGSGNVLLSIENHRADVVLNRPERRNAMNQPLLRDLRTALETVDANDDVRAMSLLGEGDVFCAGMDLEMMKRRGEEEEFELETELDDITHFIDDMRIPSVASIKGAAIAGAFELILPVDFRIISEDAKYGVVEVELGLFPSGGATQRLPRLIGLSKAKELVLTGDYIDPTEAKRCGLVHEVVSDRADTDERAREWADSLTENAPLGMEYGRQMLNSALETPLDQGLELERELGRKLTDTDDYTEDFTARLEGRDPEFQGS